MIRTSPLPAFSDNYIWVLHNDQYAAVVDPGDATPVRDFLTQNRLELTDILITHHHADHTGGVGSLVDDTAARVHAPRDAPLNCMADRVADGDEVTITSLGLTFKVVGTPGHTLDHVCYYDGTRLFCGDTLFIGGCGRLFEGTAAMMLSSLQKISSLPAETLLYCAHEYTLNNYRFAEEVDPDNPHLQQQMSLANQKRRNHQETVPGTLAVELNTNPFLRCSDPVIQQAVSKASGCEAAATLDTFRLLREWKDRF